MARRILLTLCSIALAGLVGCSGGGDGGGGVTSTTATITGQLSTSDAVASVTTRAVAADPQGSFYVEAVDETGTTQDVNSNVISEFRLEIPTNHDYVLVVGDDAGPIGAMVYGTAEQERAEFHVRNGTAAVDLGTLQVDIGNRRVRAADDSSLEQPEAPPGSDHDGDGIPDVADTDDDNDGIADVNDRRGNTDMSMDHDNDGTPDDDDSDVDNDGIDNVDDEHPRDADNDGQDDDRQLGGISGTGDPAIGAQVYQNNGCAACHGADGSGTAQASASIRGESARSIAEALLYGKGDAGGDEFMPAFPDLVDAAADLAAFLSQDGSTTSPPDTGTPVNDTPTTPDGAQLFTSNCGGCHMGNGLGGGMVGPSLTGKTLTELQNRLSGGHNGFSSSSFTDAELQAIADALTQ